jgi:hypothetical protein
MKSRENIPLDLKRVKKYVNNWFVGSPNDDTRESFENALNGPLPPQVKGMRLHSEIGQSASQNGVRLLVSDQVNEGWMCLAKGWRCRAVGIKIYLDRFDQLAYAHPDKAKNRQLPIGLLSNLDLSEILLHVMFAISFHQDEFATYCGDRLLKNFGEVDYLTSGTSDWDVDSVSLTLLKLYSLWRGVELNLAVRRNVTFGEYAEVFDAWDDQSRFGDAILRLCEIHYEGHRKRGDFETTSPYYVIPGVIWALKRIRTESGLWFPEQIEHPLMKSSLAVMPDSIDFHEPDVDICRVIEVCRKQMAVSVPWEES